MMSRCAEIACHHDVPAPPQIEICIFLAAPSSDLVGGSLDTLGGRLTDKPIQPLH